jgi:hypothetical protein
LLVDIFTKILVLFIFFSIGIDGQEGMKPIFGTTAAEEKVRLARADKVII